MAAGAAAAAAQLGRLPAPFSGRWTAPPSSSGPPDLSFGRRRKGRLSTRPVSASHVEEEQQLSLTQPEAELIEALLGIQGRGRKANAKQLQDVERAVQNLESLEGISDPTSSNLIEGRWQLMFTTRLGTASPIQRTFVGVDIFKIFQEVYLRTDDPRVLNVVRFSDAIGELKVEAAATIKDGKRILFQFDRAAFSFKFLPFKVPYPVPFRLLGDEAKGWLDTTYLSSNGNIRISRGNKGTTFVLQRETEPRQRLLSSISAGEGVEEIIQELISSNRLVVQGESEALEGEWQLLWASQSENESWSSLATYGLKGFQIVKKDGQLENLVDSFPGIKISGKGNLIKTSDNNLYNVQITGGAVLLSGFQVPLEARANFDMELLYIDNKIRITKIKKDITLVHLRLSGTNLK